jgi:NAD(P)-dependent dehydrogenase (short-subunit alcohol dehydrogenase family)
MQSVVITGASTGIGWATAKLLLDRGFRVYGSVRKQADADRLRAEFGANFVPLLFDVTDEAAVLAAAREVRVALGGETLAGLVNNAGIAVAGPVLELAADEFRRQMEVNVIGPNYRHPGLRPATRGRPIAEGKAGADRDDLFGGRQERQSAVVGLFGIQARHRRAIGKPAPRNDAVRDRRHHRGAGRGEKVRYTITPEPLQYLMAAVLPKRMVDKFIAKRLGLMPPA